MRAALQNRINPPKFLLKLLISVTLRPDNPTEKVSGIKDKTDFKTLLQNSNEDVSKEREAIANGDLSAESEEDFLKRLADQTKKKKRG